MLGNQQVYFLIGAIGGEFPAEKTVQLAAGDHAPLMIQIQIDHIVATFLHGLRLTTLRNEDVFFHAPVEKGAQAVNGNDFQRGELADPRLGLVGGDHRLLIRVQIDKYRYLITGLTTGR